MVGYKWTRGRARGGNVREDMKGQMYKATVRPLDLALGKIGAIRNFRPEEEHDYSGCWVRLEGVREWMLRNCEGVPAKFQGREDGGLY